MLEDSEDWQNAVINGNAVTPHRDREYTSLDAQYDGAQDRLKKAKARMDRAESKFKSATGRSIEKAKDKYDNARGKYMSAKEECDALQAKRDEARNKQTSTSSLGRKDKLQDAHDRLNAAKEAWKRAKATMDARAQKAEGGQSPEGKEAKLAFEKANEELKYAQWNVAEEVYRTINRAYQAISLSQESINNANQKLSEAEAAHKENIGAYQRAVSEAEDRHARDIADYKRACEKEQVANIVEAGERLREARKIYTGL